MSCLPCFRRSGKGVITQLSSQQRTVNVPKPRTVPIRQSHSSDKESFFVITAVFNPASYQRRYELYHSFAQHMKDTGAQLITVECIFPSLNQHEFQVTDPNNPFHIQLKSESVYWMKENLINIAVSRLPSHAKCVAWLDADIHFHDNNWIKQTLETLENYSVVQLFETAEFLGPDKKCLRIDHSFGYSVVKGKPIDQNRYNEWYPHPGYGWAMSINTFKLINGLPEYDIVGSGDLHFAFALVDKVSNAIERDLNPEFKNLIISQSKYIFNQLSAISKPIVGYVQGLKISHHWHGSRKNRQYMDRWKILIAHHFNYETDVRKSPEGLIVLVQNPRDTLRNHTSIPTSTLQDDIIIYFQKRNEDECEFQTEDNLLESPDAQNKTYKTNKTKKKKEKKKKKLYWTSIDFSSDSSSSLSSIEIPEIEIPDIEIPDIEIPDIEIPDIEIPDIEIPDIEIPDIEIPDIEPDIEIPSIESDIEIPNIDYSICISDVNNYENNYSGQIESTSQY